MKKVYSADGTQGSAMTAKPREVLKVVDAQLEAFGLEIAMFGLEGADPTWKIISRTTGEGSKGNTGSEVKHKGGAVIRRVL